jgi:hypothetical protein
MNTMKAITANPATKFSADQWGWLCTIPSFLESVDAIGITTTAESVVTLGQHLLIEERLKNMSSIQVGAATGLCLNQVKHHLETTRTKLADLEGANAKDPGRGKRAIPLLREEVAALEADLAALAGATVQHEELVAQATAIRDELLSIHAAGGDIPTAFDAFVRGGGIADGVPANIYQALLNQRNFYLQLNDLVINGEITPEVMDDIYAEANP